MGWLKKAANKLKGGLGAVINPTVALGTLGQGAVDMIATKYGSDLQGHENDRMRQYNLDMAREMFDKQVAENDRVRNLNIAREDAVWEREKEYNLDLWNKQNEFNSPAAQMQRLSDAGLNPNLMYGQGTTGIATAIPSSRVSPSEAQPARTNVPEYGQVLDKSGMVQNALSRYVSIRNANLMAQNMNAQNDILKEQVKATAADAKRKSVEIEITKQALRREKRENDLLDGTGASRSDNWLVRHGGRLLKFLRNKKTSISSSIADEAEKTRPFFEFEYDKDGKKLRR